ncbi:MAG: hypothetical protein WCT11_04940 [Candidatus Magasanikbacteria bacterium]
MFLQRIKKASIEVLPLLLILVGSLLITFSLRLIDPGATRDLGNGLTATGGTPIIGGIPLIIPQQNDTYFYWGLGFFLAGSLWEIIKIFKHHLTAR